ncbi:MAG: GlcNAc-transferase family protein [Pseudomonadota bacterium]
MNQYIFVSLASYLDPMLFFTLTDAMAKATRPELLRFGVVDQHRASQRAAIALLPFAGLIRYLYVPVQDTLGVSWARNQAFSLYDGEAYLLQIDSHMCFEPGWDEALRRQHRQLLERCEKPILSTYPYRFDMVDGVPHYTPPEGKTVLVLRPHPETPLTDDEVVLRFIARHLFTDQPVAGCHVAAGFVFCDGSFVDEVPYDPYLYFHGEEQSLAVRAYTRGWDIYHPLHVPLYHLYKMPNTPHETHHWHGEIDARRDFSGAYLTARAAARLNRLLCGDGLPGAYGLGNARTLEQFSAFSGIDYRQRQISDPFGGQLC